MDTCAFSEGLARLYAEFAHSIRENDSDGVRNAYKALRNSGRPISEILDEAIRTIGISYEELEMHLLGAADSQLTPAFQAQEPSIFFQSRSPEPNINSDFSSFVNLGDEPSAEHLPWRVNSSLAKLRQLFGLLLGANFSGFYARLAAWAFVVGIIGLVVIAGLITVPMSSSSTKTAAADKLIAPTPMRPVPVATPPEDVAPPLASPARPVSVGNGPPAVKSEKSDPQIEAVAPTGAATKPDVDTSSASAQSVVALKAEALIGRAAEADPTPQPTATSAARPDPLSHGGNLTPPSSLVQNEVNVVQPRLAVAANLGAKEVSKETGVALNVPAPSRRSELAPRGTELTADPSLLLARGDALFRIGDVASARGFYERAAEKGNGQAALRLGESYDPSFLHHAHLPTVRADASAAVFWYRRARDLGVTEAQVLLRDVKGE